MNHLADPSAPSIVAPARPPVIEGPPMSTALLLFAIFVGAPLVVGLIVPPAAWIPFLWLVAGIVLWCDRGYRAAPERVATVEIHRVMWRFGLSVVLLGGAIALAAPQRLFDWPRERPWLWASVLLSYPLLSVVPQELIYRKFLFRRLRLLVGHERWSMAASALAFGGLHIIYQNALAVGLTLISGWFFADTYRRTGSLRLVCVEHALYGGIIFTLGLGDFFSHTHVGV